MSEEISRTFYAGCYACKWHEPSVSLEAARELADAHDLRNHKGKPISHFGWKRD